VGWERTFCLVLGEAAWDVVFESWVLLACEAAKGSNEREEACTVDGRGGRRRHVKLRLEKIETIQTKKSMMYFWSILLHLYDGV
jgi:hypothetical protein